MSQKLAYLFCTLVGAFMCSVAAALDNGSYISQQPGIAVLLVVGIACAFGGSVLLRNADPRDWAGKGFYAAIIAAIAAAAILSKSTWIWGLDATLFVAVAAWVLKLKAPQPEPAY